MKTLGKWRPTKLETVLLGALVLLVSSAASTFDSDTIYKAQEKINREVQCVDNEDQTCTPVSASNPLPVAESGGSTTYTAPGAPIVVPASRNTYPVDLGSAVDWAIIETSAAIYYKLGSTSNDAAYLCAGCKLNTEGAGKGFRYIYIDTNTLSTGTTFTVYLAAP